MADDPTTDPFGLTADTFTLVMQSLPADAKTDTPAQAATRKVLAFALAAVSFVPMARQQVQAADAMLAGLGLPAQQGDGT